MALYTAPTNLQAALEHQSEKVSKPKGSVLFQRGTEAFGMFVVLSGKVRLDFGVDAAFSQTYGPGDHQFQSRRHPGCGSSRSSLIDL